MADRKYDKSNMKQVILDFPKQFREGFRVAKNTIAKGKFDAVLVCGMGGSALPGNVLNTWLKDQKIALPLYINRDYNLPHYIDKNFLTVCISYSGNTQETISCYLQAKKRKLPLAVITSGGKLSKLSKKDKTPIAVVPGNIQPRFALAYQSTALIKILINSGIINDNSKNILSLEKSLKPKNLESQGKKIAKKIKNRIPLFYASDKNKFIARLWKIQINENSKNPAFFNYIPELNHNEMVGFENKNLKPFYIIILRDSTDNPKNLKRMKVLASIMKKRGVAVDFINIQGKNTLSKLFSSFLLGAWASYYLALENKVDPTPVSIVEEFKGRMK